MYDEHFAKSGQVGLVMALLHKATNKVLVVGTTHLAFNPYRGDWKLHQSVHLLATIDDVVRRCSPHQCSVVVCGDLNSTPDSHLLKFFLDKNGVDFSSIKAMEVSGQTEPAEKHYKYKHGAFGEQRIEHNNLIEAGFNLDSTFGIRQVEPGVRRPSVTGHLYNTLELQSAYKNNESTSYMSDGDFCVDYILHNPRLTVDGTQDSVFE